MTKSLFPILYGEEKKGEIKISQFTNFNLAELYNREFSILKCKVIINYVLSNSHRLHCYICNMCSVYFYKKPFGSSVEGLSFVASLIDHYATFREIENILRLVFLNRRFRFLCRYKWSYLVVLFFSSMENREKCHRPNVGHWHSEWSRYGSVSQRQTLQVAAVIQLYLRSVGSLST